MRKISFFLRELLSRYHRNTFVVYFLECLAALIEQWNLAKSSFPQCFASFLLSPQINYVDRESQSSLTSYSINLFKINKQC